MNYELLVMRTFYLVILGAMYVMTLSMFYSAIQGRMNMEKPKAPTLTVSKNGYELRTEILGMAKDFLVQEYKSKYLGWEVTSTRDEKGVFITNVKMPEYPGLGMVLETAKQMYDFVNNPITESAAKSKK